MATYRKSKNHSYLIRGQYSFYFRIEIPSEIFSQVQKREIRFSLQTARIRQAKKLAMSLAVYLGEIFQEMREGRREINYEGIRFLARQHLRQKLKQTEKYIHRSKEFCPSRPERERLASEHLEQAAKFEDALFENDYSQVEDTVRTILKQNDLQWIEEGSNYFPSFCREMVKCYKVFHEIESKRLLGDYSFEEKFFPPQASVTGTVKTEQKSMSFADLVKEFQTTLRCSVKQQEAYQYVADLFVEVTGDLPVSTIIPKNIIDFYAVLKKMPPNRNKDERYRGKGFKEILSMNPSKTLSDTTLFNYQQ